MDSRQNETKCKGVITYFHMVIICYSNNSLPRIVRLFSLMKNRFIHEKKVLPSAESYQMASCAVQYT